MGALTAVLTGESGGSRGHTEEVRQSRCPREKNKYTAVRRDHCRRVPRVLMALLKVEGSLHFKEGTEEWEPSGGHLRPDRLGIG